MGEPKIKVQCDRCSKKFNVKARRKKWEVMDDVHGRVTFHYFTCPKCKMRYITHTESAMIRGFMEEMTQKQMEMKLYPLDPEEAVQRLNEIQLIKRKAKREQEILKAKYHH